MMSMPPSDSFQNILVITQGGTVLSENLASNIVPAHLELGLVLSRRQAGTCCACRGCAGKHGQDRVDTKVSLQSGDQREISASPWHSWEFRCPSGLHGAKIRGAGFYTSALASVMGGEGM